MKKYVSSADMDLIAKLYGSHKGIMYKTAMDTLGNLSDLEDVIQDAILRLIRNLDRIRELDAKACAVYVARTVYTSALDFDRRRARERNRFVGLENVVELSGGSNPEQTLVERESLEQRLRFLREALRELPETDAELLIGKYINGETNEALAERLGLRPTAIRMRLSRARNRARKIIEAKEAENER